MAGSIAFLLRRWIVMVVVAWLSGSSLLAQPIELIALTNLWRYEQSGADLGSTWPAPAYDDAAWPEGRGVLAAEFENPMVLALINTALSRLGTNGQYKLTDYFRTRFTVPSVQPGWFLIASNLVDDGSVVYLNGTELFRLRMPSGPVTATTLATETIDTGREGVFVITNVSAAGLVTGENVLAVEVHQPYITSSDVTFGLGLIYAPQEPLAIASQPAHQTILEGSTATFRLTVAGSLPRFQWFKDGAALAGAIQPTLVVPEVLRAHAGAYFVVASNEVSIVTSRVAALTVVLDRQAPILESARKNFFLDVHFSEPIDISSATNAANFRITAPGGGTVAINAVHQFSSDGVSIDLGPLTPGYGHVLFARGVRDRFGNVIAPDSGIGISTTITNIPLPSVWRYNDTGADLGEAWRWPDYDDSTWLSGPAVLYQDTSLMLQPPGVRGTELRVTNDNGAFWTHYFRLRFANSGSPVGARLFLRLYLDDGAVIYLNGHELYRPNMAAGPVDSTTRAISSAAEGVFSAAVSLPATNLQAGENVIAVEVHQYSLASPSLPDVSFGLELAAEVNSFIDGLPRVLTPPQDLTVAEGGTAVFSAHVAGAESVQWLRNGSPLAGATVPRLTQAATSANDDGAEFSLAASNSFGVVTSRAALLTVRPDSTAPRLLNARMGTNESRVVLSFSEALDAASATLASHYSITNDLGETLAVLNASLVNGTNVHLATTPRTAGPRYVVVVNGVLDVSAAGNVTAPNGHVAIDYESLLFTYDWVWRYDQSGQNLGTLWREVGYDDSVWPQGPGLLGFDGGAALPAPILTMLAPPEFTGVTDYFRTHFNFTGDTASAVVRLRHALDDGAVFYLNGKEVHRIRVPAGQNYSTLTTQSFETEIEGPFTLPTTALVVGENVLAVEVHQNSPVSEDVVFGAELVRAFSGGPSAPALPTLRINPTSDGFELSWDAAGFALECAGTVSGPWKFASQPTLPYPIPTTNAAQFFRLRD